MSTQGSFDYDDLEFDLQDRMRKAMRVGNVAPADMAATLEVHRNTISNYLNGRSTPSAAVLRVWAIRCGVPHSWLRDGSLPSDGPDGGSTQGIQESGCISDSPVSNVRELRSLHRGTSRRAA